MSNESREDLASKEKHHTHEQDEEKLARVRLEEENLQIELEKLERKLEEDEKREKEISEEIKEHHRHPKHFHLVFIINGEDYEVEINQDSLLKTAVAEALVASGNTGRREVAEWEVRDSAGVLLEMGREIESLGLGDGARLFLSLKVGAGGNDAFGS